MPCLLFMPSSALWTKRSMPCNVRWTSATRSVTRQVLRMVWCAVTMLCALGYSLYIIVLEVVSRKHPYEDLIVVQLLLLALVFLPGAWLESGPVNWLGGRLLAGILVTGPILALTMVLHNRFQRFTTATRAAVIFAAEPVFAAMFSYLLLGETLPTLQWGGAGLPSPTSYAH